MSRSLKRRKKQKLIRSLRYEQVSNLPENCLVCRKGLFGSIHHFFCDKCWKIMRDKRNSLKGKSARWCIVCGRGIRESLYRYLCDKHGKVFEKYQANSFTAKK